MDLAPNRNPGSLKLEENMGIPIIDQDECTACEECVDQCPSEALELIDSVAVVHADKCDGCGECSKVCPAGAIQDTGS